MSKSHNRKSWKSSYSDFVRRQVWMNAWASYSLSYFYVQSNPSIWGISEAIQRDTSTEGIFLSFLRGNMPQFKMDGVWITNGRGRNLKPTSSRCRSCDRALKASRMNCRRWKSGGRFASTALLTQWVEDRTAIFARSLTLFRITMPPYKQLTYPR